MTSLWDQAKEKGEWERKCHYYTHEVLWDAQKQMVFLLFGARLSLCRCSSSDQCTVAPNIHGISWPRYKYNKSPCSMKGQRLTVKDAYSLSSSKYGTLWESPLTSTDQHVFEQVLLRSTLQQAPFVRVKKHTAYAWQNSVFNAHPASTGVREHVPAQKETTTSQKKRIIIQAW